MIKLLLKKAPRVGAFFVGVCSVLMAQAAVADAACQAPAGLQPVQVRNVVDGDTVKLQDGRSVRLIGLNAPELAHNGRSEEPFAVAARERLQALVKASDGSVLVQPGREARDKYGRTLAHLYDRAGGNLEAQLLREGLAYHVAVAPNVDLVACQVQAERQARAAGVGLWRRSPVIDAGQVVQSGFAVVRGRAGAVQRNRGGIWITLDSTLVLHIAAKHMGLFSAAELARYQGQPVEARGWVLDRSRRGGLQPGQPRWMLPLTDPSMLQPVR